MLSIESSLFEWSRKHATCKDMLSGLYSLFPGHLYFYVDVRDGNEIVRYIVQGGTEIVLKPRSVICLP